MLIMHITLFLFKIITFHYIFQKLSKPIRSTVIPLLITCDCPTLLWFFWEGAFFFFFVFFFLFFFRPHSFFLFLFFFFWDLNTKMVVDLKHLFSNLVKQKRNCLTVSRIHYSIMQQCCAATCHTWKTKIMKSIMMMLGRMHTL